MSKKFLCQVSGVGKESRQILTPNIYCYVLSGKIRSAPKSIKGECDNDEFNHNIANVTSAE